jgi:serine/threonine protein kinase
MNFGLGTRFGRYEIRSKLGEGGMGEVYLARDTQLDRDIALKTLTPEVARDQQRLRRFLQEARAASALSHPNVAHIYEIGEVDGAHFIAMEYIEGEQLDRRIGAQPLALPQLLEFAIQIADALDEAHAKGITHRDIKSANVMITSRGRVKVLDFGLAKLAGPGSDTRTSDSQMATRVKTSPGVVMGTVNYMSPEQALGREVDHRSDIFSFGVVLYEMATGQLPFTGATVTETIDRITHSQPQAIARLNYDVPAELEIIVKKALRKDRAERYQTIHDLLIDLKDVKRETDVASSLERSVPPAALGGKETVNYSAAQLSRVLQQTGISAMSTAEVSAAPSASSAEYIVSEIRRHKRAFAGIVVVVLVAAVTLGGFLAYKLMKSQPPLTSPNAVRFVRLTSGGKIGNENIQGGVSISADGKYVVFETSDNQGRVSTYIRQISTNSLVRIFGPAEVSGGSGTTFSPDGEFVYFQLNDKANPDGALFKIPVLGGSSEKILTGIWSSISFSPDGQRITYVRLFPATGESWLVVANADGSGTPQTISKRKLPDYYSKDGPSWSHDGEKIVVGANRLPEVLNATLVEVPVRGGSEHPLTQPQWSEIRRVLWMSDGKGLVFTADSSFLSFGTQVWQLSYPGGQVRRVTNDLNGYGSISLGLTADDQTIATVQHDSTSNIWLVVPGQDSGRQISSGKHEGFLSVDTTADGRVVYLDDTGNAIEVWSMKLDGSDKRQLTSDGALKVCASVTRDSRYLLFTSNRSGAFNIWRMDIDGSNQKQLTSNETFAYAATGSKDGSSVVYQTLRDGKWILARVSIEGGETSQIGDRQCVNPAISPDGKSIACFSPDERASFKWQFAILPYEGGAPARLIDAPDTLIDSGMKWTADGRAIVYVDSSTGISNIYSQPIDGGPAHALTNFKSDYIGAFSWTRDGRQLVLGRGPSIDDVVLIKDFR